MFCLIRKLTEKVEGCSRKDEYVSFTYEDVVVVCHVLQRHLKLTDSVPNLKLEVAKTVSSMLPGPGRADSGAPIPQAKY